MPAAQCHWFKFIISTTVTAVAFLTAVFFSIYSDPLSHLFDRIVTTRAAAGDCSGSGGSSSVDAFIGRRRGGATTTTTTTTAATGIVLRSSTYDTLVVLIGLESISLLLVLSFKLIGERKEKLGE